jgi:hypothetical protein
MSRPWRGPRRAFALGIDLLAGTALIAVGLALPLTPARTGHCYEATADPALPGYPSAQHYLASVYEHYAIHTSNPGDFLLSLAAALTVLLEVFVGAGAALLNFRARPWISAVERPHRVIGWCAARCC